MVRSRRLLILCSCGVLLFAPGCQAFWGLKTLATNRPDGDLEAATAAVVTDEVTVAATTPPAETTADKPAEADTATADASPMNKPADDQLAAMEQVLHELVEVGALDAQARNQLLEDLPKSDPSLWPFMLQSFRTALAQRQQHADKDKDLAREIDAAAMPELVSAQPATATPVSWQRPPAANEDYSDPHEEPRTPWASSRLEGLLNGEPPQTVTAGKSPLPVTGAKQPPLERGLAQPGSLSGEVPAVYHEAVEPAGSPAPPRPRDTALALAQLHTPANVLDEDSAAVTPASYNETPLVAAPAEANAWDEQLRLSIEALEQQLQAESPDAAGRLRQEVYLRMLHLVLGQREEAMRPIAGLAALEQEYWSQQLYALAIYLDEAREADGSRRAGSAADSLRQAAARLGQLGGLQVSSLAFCTRVDSYGVYKKFPEYRFAPGEKVLLYAEVQNFHSEPTAEGFHTALRSSYQVLDIQGTVVDQHEFAVTEEHCQNVRRDYFNIYEIYIPSRAYDGTYTLQLSVEDTLGNKLGQSSIRFDVKAKQ